MVLAPPQPYYRLMPKKRPATNLAPAKTPLGRFVRDQRDARGWSQDELADRAGANLTFTNISNIERGKVGLPDPPAMIGLARALGVHPCELYVHAGYPEFAVSARSESRVGAGLISIRANLEGADTLDGLDEEQQRAVATFARIVAGDDPDNHGLSPADAKRIRTYAEHLIARRGGARG